MKQAGPFWSACHEFDGWKENNTKSCVGISLSGQRATSAWSTASSSTLCYAIFSATTLLARARLWDKKTLQNPNATALTAQSLGALRDDQGAN